MTGVVLCGGKSTRMGSDKGLLLYGEKTWAQAAFEKLSRLHVPVKVSLNPDQLNSYQRLFDTSVLVVDDSSLSVGGPLLGILSVHLEMPDEDLFVLACDLPLMENRLLGELYRVSRQIPSFDVCLYGFNGTPEPLCGIYTSVALKAILQTYHNKQLLRHSLKSVLEKLDVALIPLPDTEMERFGNFNDPSALGKL